MIVTVTLNPALDLTYPVEHLVPHCTHRVSKVSERAGGKGLNVARVLHALGEPVLATGLLGGPTGAVVAQLLDAEGVPSSFVPITGETRRTVAVVDHADATGFWEPGPLVTDPEWFRFVDHFRDLLGGAAVVALCGSLPRGVPIDGYAQLIRAATKAGVPVLLDTSGPALAHGLAAGPTVTKPNAAELADLLPAPTAAEPEAADPTHRPRGSTAPRHGRDSPDDLLPESTAPRHRRGSPHDLLPVNTVTRRGPASPAGQPLGTGEAEPGMAGPAGLAPGFTGTDAPGITGTDALGFTGTDVRRLTGGTVVVTDGAAGLRAITPDGEFRCVPPRPVTGNPTGAGDACAAALARGMRDGTAWPALLADAVALSAAAVASPVAGAFDKAVYQDFLTPGGISC
ncbi:hypothetical protein GCM10010168_20500 [Actinoplanes ianthinogenes]|uniref:Carbohydrate kinase PfkB domain-containing protein n=1 Tax=Actinoplanes ianthinogenes TaxID=122358 RepID=A0ABN6CR77_9ACTN|nr:1-phosphofructokinase family hexose kinase [Actinoplanes ianthinogenes]BCJ47691.1 hypothetical protein Aiant_83480 [Actinoplanes ianthinogenes]GGR03502.1 hypothetical protein GCM10010168_20500 [Actinoplanes ianthinogenes]